MSSSSAPLSCSFVDLRSVVYISIYRRVVFEEDQLVDYNAWQLDSGSQLVCCRRISVDPCGSADPHMDMHYSQCLPPAGVRTHPHHFNQEGSPILCSCVPSCVTQPSSPAMSLTATKVVAHMST